MPEIVGGSFTGVTVRTNVSVVLSKPSLTVIVIVVEPDWFGSGVRVTLRADPLPPNTILPFGTRPELDEVPLTPRPAAADCPSPTVNAIAPVVPSSGMLRSEILEMVGAVLLGGA